jgi:hypothetical protein
MWVLKAIEDENRPLDDFGEDAVVEKKFQLTTTPEDVSLFHNNNLEWFQNKNITQITIVDTGKGGFYRQIGKHLPR